MQSANKTPKRRVDDSRVSAIDDQIGRPRLGALIEDFLPRVAAIRRAKDAALLVVAIDVAKRAHVDDVGVRRMDSDARDGLRFPEA